MNNDDIPNYFPEQTELIEKILNCVELKSKAYLLLNKDLALVVEETVNKFPNLSTIDMARKLIFILIKTTNIPNTEEKDNFINILVKEVLLLSLDIWPPDSLLPCLIIFDPIEAKSLMSKDCKTSLVHALLDDFYSLSVEEFVERVNIIIFNS